MQVLHAHQTDMCASKAASLKIGSDGVSDRDKCLAEHARSGRVCNFDRCGAPDHRAEHHALAAQHYAQAHPKPSPIPPSPGSVTGSGSWKGKGKEKGAGDGSWKGSWKGGLRKDAKGGKGGPKGPPGISQEEKNRRAQTPCPWGPSCFKLDKEKFPGGCDYKHSAAEYAAAKAKQERRRGSEDQELRARS